MSCNISELWHSSSYKYKKILFILIKCELKASFLKKHLSYQYSIYCLILIFKILNSISLLIIYLIIKGLQRISFWLFILSPWYHSQKNQILSILVFFEKCQKIPVFWWLLALSQWKQTKFELYLVEKPIALFRVP